MPDMWGDSEPPLIAVVGPTASGKTAVGIALAQRLNGEIVSADAVAVYNGLNIGSAKPSDEELMRARFHLIDVVRPDEEFSLSDFERLANTAITEIRSRGKTPILVGGTGLYVRSVTATLTVPNVPPQPELRRKFYAEAEELGAPVLHRRLAETDPASAEKIQPGDTRRIVRALEVWHTTGQPMSSFHTPEGVRGIPKPNTFIYGLRRERESLCERIDKRVDAMMCAGLLEEVRVLWDKGYGPEFKAMQSLGYRHMLEHLTTGKALEVSVSELKADTRRFAKRQMIWFRADPRVNWIDIAAMSNNEASEVENAASESVSGSMATAVADTIIGRLASVSGRNGTQAVASQGRIK